MLPEEKKKVEFIQEVLKSVGAENDTELGEILMMKYCAKVMTEQQTHSR